MEAIENPVALKPLRPALANTEADSDCVIRDLQRIIAQYLHQCVQIAERSRTNKKLLEERFSIENKKSGECQKEMGDRGFAFTFVSIALLGAQFFAGPAAQALGRPLSDVALKGTQELASFLSNQGCQNLVGMLNGRTQQEKQGSDARSQLDQMGINEIINNQDAGGKNQLEGVMRQIGDLFQTAARGG